MSRRVAASEEPAARRPGSSGRPLRLRLLRGFLGAAAAELHHVVELCRAVGADLYFSPAGARDYIAEDGAFEAAGLPVAFQSFAARPYPQAHEGEFVPYMSFVDALMNVGWEGLAALVAYEKPA